MNKRTEQSRRQDRDGRVSVVTLRNSRTASRHEVCDKLGGYLSTFVTGSHDWQVGDAFTTADGRNVRIIEIADPRQASDRPAFTDRWTVEPTTS